ncbi:MAG: DoxX family protein [Propionibacteriaceae bacterium]|jgi:uncharacterized membrane protein YphA (DoxX/SURF4 family)|nr:DoxX family protein [Propionibacteriaceae bacterium]
MTEDLLGDWPGRRKDRARKDAAEESVEDQSAEKIPDIVDLIEKPVEQTRPVAERAVFVQSLVPPTPTPLTPPDAEPVPLTPPEGVPRRSWSTAAEVATGTTPEPTGSEVVVDKEPEEVHTEALEEVPSSTAESSIPVEGSVFEAPTIPEGTIDLTGETPVWGTVATPLAPAPESLYQEPGIGEPVQGIVEVDQLSQDQHTIIMADENIDRRAARARALGEVDPGADVVAAPNYLQPPAMYRPWPSFILFVVRLVVATILTIRATQELMNLTQIKALWENSLLAYPEIWTLSTIVVKYIIAVLLLLGLASRAAGLALATLFIIVLSFLVWGAVNPFTSGVIGFDGELEVLMVLLGLVFAGVGGGSAAIDGAIHKARLERKNARLGQEG